MKTHIGAFEAKTKLSHLLREVAAGRSFVITHRGEAVAELVPTQTPKDAAAIEDAIIKLKHMMDEGIGKPLSHKALKAMIEEGRP